jgi:uncharacterized protein
MHSPNFEQARGYAEHRLQRELSPNLFYHGIVHTREEVVPAAETLAHMEGLAAESLSLLQTAAWFHDLGFIEGPFNHEWVSARIAAEVLPGFGYREAEVEIVLGAILATALPQSPKSLLEAILNDADLDTLGRENFMDRNSDLRQELASLGKVFTDQEWYIEQLNFLETHKYFTASARIWRDAQKQLNIAKLRKKLEQLNSRN